MTMRRARISEPRALQYPRESTTRLCVENRLRLR